VGAWVEADEAEEAEGLAYALKVLESCSYYQLVRLFFPPFPLLPPALLPPYRLHNTRSTRAKPNTVSDITPFMVKKAASSLERSPGLTRWCSYARMPVATMRPR
jgi:hypothetical protein